LKVRDGIHLCQDGGGVKFERSTEKRHLSRP
jgi:hypothetical protein